MLCAPALHGLVANVADHGVGPRMRAPKERAARLGLARAGNLNSVVCRRGPEPVPPLRLTVVAIRAGVSEDVDTLVPYFQRESVGVSMCSDGQETMGPPVAPTPDLRSILWART